MATYRIVNMYRKSKAVKGIHYDSWNEQILAYRVDKRHSLLFGLIHYWDYGAYNLCPTYLFSSVDKAEEAILKVDKSRKVTILYEYRMKIRLAQKIMKYKSIVDEYNNCDGSVCDGMKESYWLKRMFDHINGVYDETFDTPAHIPFRDHRITKAISLFERWNARSYRNDAAKFNKKNPLRQRDLRRSVERLKQYSV